MCCACANPRVGVPKAKWPTLCRTSGVPDKTVCITCRRDGLVRFEVVIKGKESSLSFYCGYCETTWQAADRRETRNVIEKKGGEPRLES